MRASLFDGFFGAIFGYAMAVAIVLVLALVIDLLAPLFGGRKDFDSAFKLAVYSYTPVWLAGIFLLLPGLRFLILSSFYGAYVLALGLPRLMKSPEQKSYGYAVVIVVCACALTLIAAAIQRIGVPHRRPLARGHRVYGAFTTCLHAAGNAASVGPVRGPGGFSGGFGCSTPAVNQ